MFVWLIKITVALTLVSWIGSTMWRVLPTFGAALPQESYSSCKQLRADYPAGLAATGDLTPDIARPPRAFAQAYVLNMHLDPDHDGIICAPAP